MGSSIDRPGREVDTPGAQSLAPGIVLLHKPVGPTSFTLVREAMAQRDTAGRRWPLCHGGTLDPFAHGLLLLLVGPSTRLFEHLHGVPKVYRAHVRWGAETDTGDAGGKVVGGADPGALTPEALDQALQPFVGWREQVPPATSAKKVGGEPAYRKAHRGEVVVLPPSRVYLHQARWTEHRLPHDSQLELTCRGGYYVRALARDLGRAVGCGAHLGGLWRESIGPWRDPGPGAAGHLSGTAILPWCPSRALTDAEVGVLRREGTVGSGEVTPPTWSVPEGFPAPDQPVRGFHLGRLVALLRRVEEGKLALQRALWPGL